MNFVTLPRFSPISKGISRNCNNFAIQVNLYSETGLSNEIELEAICLRFRQFVIIPTGISVCIPGP